MEFIHSRTTPRTLTFRQRIRLLKKRNAQILKKIFFSMACSMVFLNFNVFAMDKSQDVSETSKTPAKRNRTPSFIINKKKDQTEESRQKRKSFVGNLPNRSLTRSATESSGDPESSYSSVSSYHSITSTEEGDSDSSLSSPTTRPNTKEATAHLIAYIFKHNSPAEASKIILYSLPFVTDSTTVFEGLLKFQKKYPKYVRKTLEDLVLQGFPHGIKSLLPAMPILNELNKVTNIPALNEFYLSNLTLRDDSELSPFLNQTPSNEERTIDEKTDMGQFKNALCKGNILLMRPIELCDILKSDARVTFIRFFTQITRFISLHIITAATPKERDQRYRKFSWLGCYFIQEKNFHGAMQVATALYEPSVQRLMEEDNLLPLKANAQPLIPKKESELKGVLPIEIKPLQDKIKPLKDKNWTMLSDFSNPHDNCKRYREEITKAQIEQHYYFPSFETMAGELERDITKFKFAPDIQEKVSILEAITTKATNFSKCRFLTPPPTDDPKYLKLMCSLDIHEETLDVFSDFRKPWPEQVKDRDTTKLIPLNEWTPLYFVSFLRDSGLCAIDRKIFLSGIHEGKHLIQLMGTVDKKDQEERLANLKLTKKMINFIIASYNLYQPVINKQPCSPLPSSIDKAPEEGINQNTNNTSTESSPSSEPDQRLTKPVVPLLLGISLPRQPDNSGPSLLVAPLFPREAPEPEKPQDES